MTGFEAQQGLRLDSVGRNEFSLEPKAELGRVSRLMQHTGATGIASDVSILAPSMARYHAMGKVQFATWLQIAWVRQKTVPPDKDQ
jgi:hypothetical protein